LQEEEEEAGKAFFGWNDSKQKGGTWAMIPRNTNLLGTPRWELGNR
jgi:hypothetical protein